MYKTPCEIASVVKKQTFYVESHLSPINEQADRDAYYPLMTYSHFSRYSFCIINEEKKAASTNIPIQEMRELIRRHNFLLNKHLESILKPESERNSVPAAYTVQLTSGDMKGKTPAQVLLEKGEEGRTMLKNQYRWLEKNVEKYRKNQIQMDAIAEACRLFLAGELNEFAAKSGGSSRIILYEAKSRINPYRRRDDGMCPVRDTSIVWDVGGETPVTIMIKNFYAPYRTLDNGLIVAMPDKMDRTTFVSNTMHLSEEEWCSVVDNIQMNMRQFEYLNAGYVFNEADRMNAENRKELYPVMTDSADASSRGQGADNVR